MIIGEGNYRYEWSDTWANIPNPSSAKTGWSHNGVVVTEQGKIITLHHGDLVMLEYNNHGTVERSWQLGLEEAHEIVLVKERDSEFLWIADNGRKRSPETGYEYPNVEGLIEGKVVKTTLYGDIILELPTPSILPYKSSDYMPTSVAVNQEVNGGNGDIWVSDGYGQNYVHRYDKQGKYLSSINGEEGQLNRFNCPHSVFWDTRKQDHELLIADRGNGYVQVYDADGKFKRGFGFDYLSSPSGFALDGDNLIITELRARLTIVDMEDRLVSYLGDNEQVCNLPGWPNAIDDSGNTVATQNLKTGKFNSPHGIAVDAQRNIYVSEWLIGGRLVKLTKS
ncbi:MAG: hypothetical protein VX701_03830 [Chloroflexota bacterium]|nr:hypothetical protein [Chloroflexota bacterium]